MKISLPILISAVAFGFWTSTSLAQPKLLLSDTFERTTGNTLPANGATLSDWGMNNNSLGGTIQQTYITTPTRTPEAGGVDQTVQDGDDPTNGENEGVIRFGATVVNYNLATDPNVLAGGGYTVEFKGRRTVVTGNNFLSFFLGTDPNKVATTSPNAAFLPVTSMMAGEHTYLWQKGDFDDLQMQMFEFGGDFEDPPGKIFDVAPFHGDEFTALVTVLAPNGFDVGDQLTISASINGNKIDGGAGGVAGGGDGGPESGSADHTVTITSAFTGYVGWSANSGSALIDDLKITALGTAPAGIPGDYNGDLVVDAADYTVWRDNLNAVTPLPNDNGLGTPVGTAHYDLWRANYGATLSPTPYGLQVQGVAAPEPAGAVLLVVSIFLGFAARRRVV